MFGSGAVDLVFVPGFVSNVEAVWSSPARARFFERLGAFARVVMFDKRGTGMSDRSSQVFTLEQRMDDVRAVMDEVGWQRAALFGFSEGGPMSVLFAATFPERTTALVLYGAYARRSWAPDYSFAWRDADWERLFESIERRWGATGDPMLALWAPSIAHDPAAAAAAAAYFRASASPGAALAIMRMNREIDVREVLPSVSAPTLVVHRVGERVIDVEHARYQARHIPRAKLVELPGVDHVPWSGDADAVLQEVEEFLTGERHAPDLERVLATVLFVDIVQSTERAAALGDRGWRDLLQSFQEAVRRQLAAFRGREIDTAGDGFLAAFDGPARAIRCAAAIRAAAQSLALAVRAGVHTGECEIMGEKLGGIAVHTGARVAGSAAPGEILVSQTVKDLVAGSGLPLADRGAHQLKGIPGDWRLYAYLQQ